MKKNNLINKPDYGNWVSRRLIYIPGILALVFFALSMLSPLSLIIAIPFMVISLYFGYAYYEFSSSGKDIQTKIREVVLKKLAWNGQGKALDIGCGNGALAINLALRYPESLVTGIDYWGGRWEYSQNACNQNAEIEGVSKRITFQSASASALPFEDESFDAAISNFVFHEVSDAKDKREIIKEALRIVKKGGSFAFQDLFPNKAIYGEIDDLLMIIKTWGVQNVSYMNTSNAKFIPNLLRLPFMIGSIGIIYGVK
jgi:ubiquinone/menaquinone biosynthesis C-methylase UbiE